MSDQQTEAHSDSEQALTLREDSPIALKENSRLTAMDRVQKDYALMMASPSYTDLERMVMTAKAIGQLREMLDEATMAYFMQLQGSRMGFVTDKDKSGGYSVQEAKEAVLMGILKGFPPVNNRMNIISGQFYGTKQGFRQAMIDRGYNEKSAEVVLKYAANHLWKD